ncbi:glycosyltransferase involved in cell wall biosynthesis [Trinickia symbiotica]|uniref:Glycosyl transferase family 1 n=1 Tax=Trinickia symbiotica TaxID=863227 RepID=A0A2N7X5J6_9BURK|nr:glycosyltransferase family 4 protein [Trinickia symbiotica]PMS37036.1 glycosyl transferase family 1 [Trinickia symbiotica]PPK43032.1 glycosyltransferase involved in cell wall biosynthesis [Trinickia symbiotica]
MRILFVIGNLGDYHVPRYEALTELAADRGHQVSLVEGFSRSPLYDFPQARRAAFFNSSPSNAVTLLEGACEADGHWCRIGAGVFAALRRFNPDVVVTHGYNSNYSFFLLLAKLLRRRFALIYMSDSKADDGKRYLIKEGLKRIVVSRYDGALVAGEKHRAYAKSLGIPMARSRIGFDVIDVDYFSKKARAALASASTIRERFGLPERYVLCVSRFVKRKNVDLVIEAFFRSGLHAAGLSLVLVGQGPCEGQIRDEIDRRGMKNHIVVLNSVVNSDMPGLYSLAEFVVLGSAFDQWGLCINEAFAAGRPAIVTRTCGVANELVLEGLNGFIVEPGDVSAMADRMVQLATVPGMQERLSDNAAWSIRRWTPKFFATNVIELAESLAGAETAAYMPA